MSKEPTLDLSAEDLQNIVVLCNLGIKTQGRPVSKIFDALADKIELYLNQMAQFEQNKQQAVATGRDASVAAAVAKRAAAAKANASKPAAPKPVLPKPEPTEAAVAE